MASGVMIKMLNQLYIREILLKHMVPKDSYVADLPIVRQLQRKKRLTLQQPVTFFVGENGTGKSTLLEAIAVAYGFNAEGGSKNFLFSTAETHSPLYQSLSFIKGAFLPRDGFFLRAESFYNVASYVDEMERIKPFLKESYGGKSLHQQSHGESFLSLVLHRFSGHGIYLLDEPEAALSPMKQLTLLSRIHQLVQMKSQFIIATHSPMLMAYPQSEIFVLSENDIVKTPYQQTDHYVITKQFLENPERMLQYLLAE